MLKTKCVYSPIDQVNDGLRILTARFLVRGLRKERYDVWMPNLGPTETLLRSFGQISWEDYAKRYLEELFLDGSIDIENRRIKNHGQKFTLRLLRELAEKQPITLMCHCAEEEQHCHRHVLQRLILSKKI